MVKVALGPHIGHTEEMDNRTERLKQLISGVRPLELWIDFLCGKGDRGERSMRNGSCG